MTATVTEATHKSATVIDSFHKTVISIEATHINMIITRNNMDITGVSQITNIINITEIFYSRIIVYILITDGGLDIWSSFKI